MIANKKSLRKITMATGVVAMTVGLVSAFSFEANAQATTGGGYFCKNDPTKNTGKCYVWATGASCDATSTSNKDCFGTGQD